MNESEIKDQKFRKKCAQIKNLMRIMAKDQETN